MAIANASEIDQQQETREHLERGPPAQRIDQADGERREQELTERAGGGAGAEGERTPAFRQQLSE